MMFSFFKRIRLRIRDIGTIKELCLGAEKHAHKNGEETPGAEHFLLSAMDLSDGTALRVFEHIGADPGAFGEAIKKQYADALNSIGVDSDMIDSEDENAEIEAVRQRLYDAQPSGQFVMQQLVELRKKDRDIPLLGAHVVDVVASMEHGVAARSLNAMGVDRQALKAAIRDELGRWDGGR